MKKELPFVMPLTTCYPSTSHASGILFADPYIENWMFNNFIQLFEVEDNGAIDYYDFAIDNNPYLSYNEINYDFIYHNWSSIRDFIISCIRDNYYVRVFNNISKNSLYGTDKVMQHDILIFGYDCSNETYKVADHFINGKFEIKACAFEELEQAIDTYNPVFFDTNPIFMNSVQLIYKENDLRRLRYSMYTSEQMDYMLALNIPRIIGSLKDYVNSSPTLNWYTRGVAMDTYLSSTHRWGIDCYDVILDNLKEKKFSFLVQSCHIFNNHKKVMIERIKKIKKNLKIEFVNNYEELFAELEHKTKRLEMMVIKFRYSGSERRNILKIEELLNEIKSKEKKYVSELIQELEKYYTDFTFHTIW